MNSWRSPETHTALISIPFHGPYGSFSSGSDGHTAPVRCTVFDRPHKVVVTGQDLAEKLCDGSVTPVIIHLFEGAKLSQSDREMLLKLIVSGGVLAY